MTHPCSSAAPGNDAGRRRVEDNKAVARRWFDLVTRGRVEELCAMTAPTWTMHGGPPALPTGPDGIRTLFHSFGRIDQTWTVEEMIAESDKVAVRATNICSQESFLRNRAGSARWTSWRQQEQRGYRLLD